MTHHQAVTNRTAARYLLRELSDKERDAFEEHYFECRACGEDVRAGTAMFVTGREVVAAHDTRVPVLIADDTRDHEVAEVLDEIRQRLTPIDFIRGAKRDQALEAVEAYAGQFALVLFYEIARLDAVISRLQYERLRQQR